MIVDAANLTEYHGIPITLEIVKSMNLRERLAPRIRAAGINNVASAAGIPRSTLSEWLAGKRNRRLGDAQIDAIATSLGITISITEDNNNAGSVTETR